MNVFLCPYIDKYIISIYLCLQYNVVLLYCHNSYLGSTVSYLYTHMRVWPTRLLDRFHYVMCYIVSHVYKHLP